MLEQNYQSFVILEGGTEPSKEWNYVCTRSTYFCTPYCSRGPNMSMPSVGAMGTEQCSVLGQKTFGIWDPVGSQESEDMKYVAIK